MSTIEKYIFLITRFVTGEITAVQFEASYLKMFKNESMILPEETYDVLNELFLCVDEYCNDPDLRDEEDLGDSELLESAKEALSKLA